MAEGKKPVPEGTPARKKGPIALIPAVDGGDVWERLKGETRPSYSNFVAYREQTRGRHSLSRLAVDLGKTKDAMTEQSVKYRWQERIDAYEDYLDRRDRQVMETERDRVNRDGAALFRRQQLAAARRMQGDDTDPEHPVTALDPNEMTWTDVRAALDSSWKGLRNATGQPTDFVAGRFSITGDDLTRIVQGVYEIAERLLPPERHGRFATEVQSFFDRGGTS